MPCPSPRLSRLRTWLPLSLLLAGSLGANSARGQYCTRDQCDECSLCSSSLRCCHEAPELWVINTRHVAKCNGLDEGFERIKYQRWDPQCRRFVRESRESFLACEASMPTLFFVHGNTLQHEGAMKSAWEFHQRLRCCPGPKRLVLWSWPAQIAITRPLIRPRQLIEKNLKLKFVYAEYQGYYMAKLVQQMSLAQRVTLSGHSYGGITAAVALHYLGGGSLRGLTLAGGAPVERPNLRAAIISGAFDNDAMDLCGRYGLSFVVAEKVYNTRNARDKTLDTWPKISQRGRQAIGVTGIRADRLGDYRDKLCQHTLTSDVGRSHYMGPHLDSNKFVAALCCLSFGNGSAPTLQWAAAGSATESETAGVTPSSDPPAEAPHAGSAARQSRLPEGPLAWGRELRGAAEGVFGGRWLNESTGLGLAWVLGP